MTLLRRPAIPPTLAAALTQLELLLITAMAVLLPFDHWFFGHMVNPAPMRVLGFVLTGVWLLQAVLGQWQFRLQRWHITVVIFLAVCFYSATFSPVIPDSPIYNYQYKLIAVSKIVAAMLFFVLACQAFNIEKLRMFLRVHLFMGAVICSTSLVLYFLHLYKIWPHNFALWVDQDIYNFVRIQGVSFEPQRFGAYMLTQLPFFLSANLRHSIGWPTSKLDPLILVIMLATTILSYAISTYIVMPLLLMALMCTSRSNFRKLVWLLLAIAALITVLLSIPAIREATFEIIDVKLRGQSMSKRQHNWSIAVLEFMFFPWTGVGPEGYSYFYPYFDTTVVRTTPASHPPHSLFFGLLANMGIPGVASFALMLGAFAASLIRRYRQNAVGNELAYTLAIIAFAHLLIQANIWLPWSLNQWLYMAMAWCATTQSYSLKNRRNESFEK